MCRAQQKQTAAKELLSSSGLPKRVCAMTAQFTMTVVQQLLHGHLVGWEYIAHPSPAIRGTTCKWARLKVLPEVVMCHSGKGTCNSSFCPFNFHLAAWKFSFPL